MRRTQSRKILRKSEEKYMEERDMVTLVRKYSQPYYFIGQAIQETIDSIMELLNKTIKDTAEVSKNAVMEAQKFALRTKLDCVILAPVVFLPQGAQ